MDTSTTPLLWRRIEGRPMTPPRWVNAPSFGQSRIYGFGSRLTIEGDVFRLAPRPASTFVLIFGCVFLPTFLALAWFKIPSPQRWIMVIGGTIAGLTVFGISYGVLRQHELLGDYLVIDRSTRIVQLPRLKLEFPFERVDAIQWITGPTQSDIEKQIDLNLLVREGETIVRYHIMGMPWRRSIEEAARFSGLAVEELVDTRDDRDRDAKTA